MGSGRYKICKTALFFSLAMVFVSVESLKSRSVNLALETSFLFDPQDIKENATFIHKVQDILDKLRGVLDPKGQQFRRNADGNITVENEKAYLTTFLSKLGSSLINVDNENIKKFTSDLKEVVYKHAEKSKEFNEIIEDDRLQAFIKNSVKVWAETDPVLLKLEVAKLIILVDVEDIINLFKMINRFFDDDDAPKFKKLLSKFKKSIKHNDYKKFLSKTIEFVVFKRYKKLDLILKNILKEELKRFTDYVTANYKDRTITAENNRRFSLASIAQMTRLENDAAEKESLGESSDNTDKTKDKVARTKKESNEEGNDVMIANSLNMTVKNNGDKGISLKVD